MSKMTEHEAAFENALDEIRAEKEEEVFERIREDRAYRERIWQDDPTLRREIVWDLLDYEDTHDSVMDEYNTIFFAPSK